MYYGEIHEKERIGLEKCPRQSIKVLDTCTEKRGFEVAPDQVARLATLNRLRGQLHVGRRSLRARGAGATGANAVALVRVR